MTSPGWFSVQFPRSSVTGRISWKSLEVLQDINKHDVCVVTFRSFVPSYPATLGPGTPVTIQYGARGSIGTFVGNVAKASPSKKLGDNYEHTLTCVSTSRQLRQTDRNVWNNKTYPEVVQAIGKKLGFKVVTKQHSLRKKTITQTGGPYWKFLTEIANLCGYALRVEGTTIYFLPLSDMIKVFTAGASQFSYSNGTDTARIFNFTASLGNTSDDPDDLADSATVTSFGPSDTEAVDVTEYPGSAIRPNKTYRAAFDKSNPRTIAYTRAEAKALAKGMADRGQMAYDAHLSSGGEPGLSPYHPVYIDSGDTTTTGWWIVKSARHTIIKNEYTCESVVSTDEVSQQTAVRPSRMPFKDPYTEEEYGLGGDTTILSVPDSGYIAGETYTPDSWYSEWYSTSPGLELTPNYGLLTTLEGTPDGTFAYPSVITFPSLTLYPTL